jgi:hypothetical protein
VQDVANRESDEYRQITPASQCILQKKRKMTSAGMKISNDSSGAIVPSRMGLGSGCRRS